MNVKLQRSRINDVLYEIHRDISVPLFAKDLAQIAAYSEQHFHRIFKQVVGETINVYIRRTRLEHAANQLMFDHSSSVLTIAEKCGFLSLSSFNKAFKAQFGMTPGDWRNTERKRFDTPYLADEEIKAGYERIKEKDLPQPEVMVLKSRQVAYVRHQGYGRDIRQAWLLLQAWALQEGIVLNNEPLSDNLIAGQQLGLHHSNPAWVDLKHCRYVACITIDKPLRHRGSVNQLTIPGGLHVAFDLQGRYGELLPWIGKILETWLPESGYKLQTTPAFIHYRKNQFTSVDDLFDVRVFLPVSVV
jgi:AraC family transcriptional regulator